MTEKKKLPEVPKLPNGKPINESNTRTWTPAYDSVHGGTVSNTLPPPIRPAGNGGKQGK